jgi:hypothetical protein
MEMTMNIDHKKKILISGLHISGNAVKICH